MQPVRRPAGKKKRLGVYCFSCRETKINGRKKKKKNLRNKFPPPPRNDASSASSFFFLNFIMEITNIPQQQQQQQPNWMHYFDLRASADGPSSLSFRGNIRVTNCWPGPKWTWGIKKKEKCARWSIHHTHTHTNNKKYRTKEEDEKTQSCVTDLDRRWCRRRWIRREPIGRRWLYWIVLLLRKSRIELLTNQDGLERRHCCWCWAAALPERQTACAAAAAAVASIHAIATCSS